MIIDICYKQTIFFSLTPRHTSWKQTLHDRIQLLFNMNSACNNSTNKHIRLRSIELKPVPFCFIFLLISIFLLHFILIEKNFLCLILSMFSEDVRWNKINNFLFHTDVFFSGVLRILRTIVWYICWCSKKMLRSIFR